MGQNYPLAIYIDSFVSIKNIQLVGYPWPLGSVEEVMNAVAFWPKLRTVSYTYSFGSLELLNIGGLPSPDSARNSY